MTAMFPDSGVPASDAKNSIAHPDTVNCDELWYSTSRCQPRFDPAAANAVLAELINLINQGEVVYDCAKLDQVQLAVRYLIQRGLPCGIIATGGPLNYVVDLDPPATRQNNYMTLVLVPEQNNAGPVRINVNGLGLTSVVRNDGQPLESLDWLINQPLIVSFWGGVWHMIGLVPSQVLKQLTGARDVWVRPDGNDLTGDGTANSADKAFRTINGAWNDVAQRYAVSPIYPINIRLGIPGSYEPGHIGPYGGPVYIYGNITDRSVYKLQSLPADSLRVGINAVDVSLRVVGVNIAHPAAGTGGYGFIAQNGATLVIDNCQMEINDNSHISGMFATAGASLTIVGSMSFSGMGGVRSIRNWMSCAAQALFFGGQAGGANSIAVNNLNFLDMGITCEDMSTVRFTNCTVSGSGNSGVSWSVIGNSLLNRVGQTMPGSGTGTTASGGSVI